LTALAGALVLAGCASFTPFTPSTKTLDSVSLSTPVGVAKTSADWPQEQWWKSYGDAQLDRLLAHALENSPSLKVAQTRIARAQAAAGYAQSNTAPTLSADGDFSYGRYSENYQVPKPPIGKGGVNVGQGRVALDFSYDLDLWGKNSALIDSAQAQLKAAGFDRDAARLALTTSMVRAYVQLSTQYALQDILQDTLKQRIAIRELSAQRVSSGLDTRVELLQSSSNESALHADLAQLESTLAVTRLQLTALAGDMPTAAADIARPALQPVDFTLPANLPLDLLGRRPELAAQRARLVAAIGESNAARAQFYPNINLSAYIGMQAFGLGQLLAAGSFTDSVGPAIRLPIFEGGRLRTNYALKNADVDAAIAQYNQSVIAAAQDVSEQLTRAASLAGEGRALQDALDASTEAHRLAMIRYKGGLSPYLTVLSVETQLLGQRRALLDLNARRLELQVSLVRALGGGFVDAPKPTAVALATNSK
jgi:NodT family efflux transporter outer membrane factor (OMF) lipoprotein